jgi:hypothetical protein
MAYMPTRVGDESHTAGSISLHPSRSPQEIGGANYSDPLTISVKPAKKRLCSSCRETFPQNWFKSLPTEGPITLKVGQLSHAREKQESCPFCRFLVEVYELAGIQPAANGNERETVYFAREKLDGPWYTVAAIEAELPPVPAVWLEFGHPHVEQHKKIRKSQDPDICISCMPSAASDKIQNAQKYAYPRQRRWEKASGGFVDYDLIKSWLQVCQTQHSYLCCKAMMFERQVLKLKVIDVGKRVVEAAQDRDKYVALSYVWGEGSHRKISAELKHAIRTGTTLPTLPKTVEDAMVVVGQLGERYLWVDWCCIDQDDEEDKKIQIQTMDLVYECAFCTIVAVDGVNAKAGLSGVSRSLQQWGQPVVDIQDCCLMATNIDPVSDNHAQALHFL